MTKTIGNLPYQTIGSAMVNQDITLVVPCYEMDGTTTRPMAGASYLLTWVATSTDRQQSITKTSAAGQIILGSPDDEFVAIAIENTDIPAVRKFFWTLTSTDADGDNQAACAVGEWSIEKCQ